MISWTNFAEVEFSAGFDSAATTATLVTNDGAKLPKSRRDGPFPLVIWNNTDHANNPLADSAREIVWVHDNTGDSISTMLRGQDDTAASNHNTGGKTYRARLIPIAEVHRWAPRRFVLLDEHFDWASSTVKSAWDAGGTGTLTVEDGEQDAYGVISIGAGSGATNAYRLHKALNTFRLGNAHVTWEARVKLGLVPTSTDDFTARLGFGDTNLADHADGIYFETDRGTDSTNWRIACASNSTRTKATGGAMSTSWHKLKIAANVVGDSVRFFHNDAEVSGSPITANIPTGSGRHCGPWNQCLGLAGTNTARKVFLDWLRVAVWHPTAN